MQQVHARDVPALIAKLASQGRAPMVLDVREPWEVQLAAVRPAGAATMHMPMREVPTRLAELDAAQPILALCHHGARSMQVVAFLAQRGFDHVYNIAGGTHAWSTEVDPTVPTY